VVIVVFDDGSKWLTDVGYGIYQVRNSPDREFGSCYSFIDAEHITEDFAVMNYYTSTHPKSYMTNTALVVKFLHNDFNVYGKRMLINSEIRENSGSKTELVATCNTEAERIRLLEEKFGLTLTEDEQRAIHDTKFALSPS
jgi:arylamine N-acetyltransferase